jgi:hypothetical protein
MMKWAGPATVSSGDISIEFVQFEFVRLSMTFVTICWGAVFNFVYPSMWLCCVTASVLLTLGFWRVLAETELRNFGCVIRVTEMFPDMGIDERQDAIGWTIKVWLIITQSVKTPAGTPILPKSQTIRTVMRHITIPFPTLVQDDWDVLSETVPETECDECLSRNAPDGDRTVKVTPRRSMSRRRQ